jgi:hypothetical protein
MLHQRLLYASYKNDGDMRPDALRRVISLLSGLLERKHMPPRRHKKSSQRMLQQSWPTAWQSVTGTGYQHELLQKVTDVGRSQLSDF